VYVTEVADDATTTVEFGDGAVGARLPTGAQNVRATYRIGLGTSGNVGTGALSLLAARPLAVQSVTNPVPATGGGDPEVLADARTNAGLTIQTLGRVVSLADYQSFSQAFAGVGKASAAYVWDGYRRSVLVTLAASDGSTVDPTANPAQNLVTALTDAGDPWVSIVVASYVDVTFKVAMVLAVQPDYANAFGDVLAAVEAALRGAFGFAPRSFGQSVMFSEVITVAQQVTGVLAVTVTAFYRTDAPAQTPPPVEMPGLPAQGPQPPKGGLAAVGAELLTLDPGPIALSVMT
jgi:predicted phage baseplate assembly protein